MKHRTHACLLHDTRAAVFDGLAVVSGSIVMAARGAPPRQLFRALGFAIFVIPLTIRMLTQCDAFISASSLAFGGTLQVLDEPISE